MVALAARAVSREAPCPGCGCTSSRVHGRYRRRLADLAVAGRKVVIDLLVRRFLCGTPECGRRTFVEHVEGLTERFARRTPVLRRTLERLTLALAGRPAARLAAHLSIPASPNSPLRLLGKLPDKNLDTAPRVLGVDDFAFKKVIWSRSKGVHDVEYGPARRRVLRCGGGYLPPSITQNLPEEPCLFSGSSLPQRGWSRGPCSAMMTHRSPRSSAISPT
ncbi:MULTISPECIES: transposase family protein [Streptomyces]|uniref:transposase family protein n=1 Tax=Streptomyces lycopersici TaxID=2974589 RepID=UPI003524AB4F